MAIQGRPWSLLVVPIRACWWWEREIGGDCLARLWREKLRERECKRERESVKDIGLRGREKMQNFTEISSLKNFVQICLD